MVTLSDSDSDKKLLDLESMPGGFNGANRHQTEARERDAARKVADREKKQKDAEDAYWKDDDKITNRKAQRQQDDAEKMERRAQARDERDKLEADENAELGKMKSKKNPAKKLTQAELNARLAAFRKKRAEAATAEKEQSSRYTNLPDHNPNRVELPEDEVVATTVDDAILALGGSITAPIDDPHPERRRKALHEAFVQRNLPRVRLDHPGLKLSQYKEMLFKEWLKSPENPTYAAAAAAGAAAAAARRE